MGPVKVYTPSETAKKLGVEYRELDKLETVGVLRPAFVTVGGHRRYSVTDVHQLYWKWKKHERKGTSHE